MKPIKIGSQGLEMLVKRLLSVNQGFRVQNYSKLS